MLTKTHVWWWPVPTLHIPPIRRIHQTLRIRRGAVNRTPAKTPKPKTGKPGRERMDTYSADQPVHGGDQVFHGRDALLEGGPLAFGQGQAR